MFSDFLNQQPTPEPAWHQYLIFVPIILSLIAIILTLRQVTLLRRQMQLDALMKIVQSNRDLLTLGFQKPALWEFHNPHTEIDGIKDKVAQEERRRYFQLWVNHIHVIWMAHSTGLYDRAHWTAARNDLAKFLKLEPLQRHWEQVKLCYPKDFQKEIGRLIGKPDSDGQSAF